MTRRPGKALGAAAILCVVSAIGIVGTGCGSADETDGGEVKVVDEEDDGPEATSQELSCSEILDCLTDCPEGDDACIDDCGERGTERGLELLEEWWNCVQANGCDDEPEEEIGACLRQYCEAETRSCLQDGTGQRD